MITFAILLLFCGTFLSTDIALAYDGGQSEIPREHTLVICKVSQNPKKHAKEVQPIVDYAVSQLGHLGIKAGKVLFARNNR